MSIALSNGRRVNCWLFGKNGHGTLSVSSEWPGIDATISMLTSQDFRAIAMECTRIADEIEHPAIPAGGTLGAG